MNRRAAAVGLWAISRPGASAVTPDVSVVIPLRDEERNVLPLHEQLTRALVATLGIPYEYPR